MTIIKQDTINKVVISDTRNKAVVQTAAVKLLRQDSLPVFTKTGELVDSDGNYVVDEYGNHIVSGEWNYNNIFKTVTVQTPIIKHVAAAGAQGPQGIAGADGMGYRVSYTGNIDGENTVFTTAVACQDILVFDESAYIPPSYYTYSGTTLTFTAPPAGPTLTIIALRSAP